MVQDNNKPIILDLGCGKNKEPGAIGLDNIALEGVNIVHDLLDFPYPLEDRSVQRVMLRHVLEHFYLGEILKIMNEVHRILRDDGDVIISVPHAFSTIAVTDPTHKKFFGFSSFHYLTGAVGHYRAFDQQAPWRIIGLWASVNLVSDLFKPASKWGVRASDFCSKILNYVMRKDKTRTLPDIIAKILPGFMINIHCALVKDISSLQLAGNEWGRKV